jgi:hypothetical protein
VRRSVGSNGTEPDWLTSWIPLTNKGPRTRLDGTMKVSVPVDGKHCLQDYVEEIRATAGYALLDTKITDHDLTVTVMIPGGVPQRMIYRLCQAVARVEARKN